MIGAFLSVLRDNEAEVKTAACSQLAGFAVLVPADILLAEIVPCVRELVSDSSQHVRASLAIHISGLAPLLGKEK